MKSQITQLERKAARTISAWVLRAPTLQDKRAILQASAFMRRSLVNITLNEAALSQLYATEAKN